MRITHLDYGIMKVPLITPFKTAVREVTHMADLVVRLHTDTGLTGYGSAPATPQITGDTHATMLAVLKEQLQATLLGQSPAQLSALCGRVQGAIVGHTSIKAALEVALYDLWSQHMGVPLYVALGGSECPDAPELDTDITISVNDTDTMVQDCHEALKRGYRTLKIKVGKDPQSDFERIRTLYHSFSAQCALRLDVNQGWSAKQTIATMRQLEQQGCYFELVEQPVKANDTDGLQRITQAIDTPVMADESVFSSRQALALLQNHTADILNIKLMKTGGLTDAIHIADLAQQFRTPCMIGCMLEGSISVAAAAHFAVAKSKQVPLIDLDGPTLATHNPVQGGCQFNDSKIMLNTTPGLGIEGIDGVSFNSF